MIAVERRQIRFLREFYARLIADIVTGKLDVREAVAELSEVDPLATDDETIPWVETGDDAT